jgi:hypothetical protein
MWRSEPRVAGLHRADDPGAVESRRARFGGFCPDAAEPAPSSAEAESGRRPRLALEAAVELDDTEAAPERAEFAPKLAASDTAGRGTTAAEEEEEEEEEEEA